ncbi:MAG: winged helix-turn-helix transcriptional regulator [Nitrososphaeria archaeon]|nr:winged helix-turn-helix transcriptional regulator [Nitrososphaeria archaeon]
MVKGNIDDLDLKILKLLKENARVQCNEIAKVVGVSDRTVARRIKRMESNGIIKGYSVELCDDVIERFFPSTKEFAGGSPIMVPAVCWDNILNVIVGTFGVGGVLIVFNIGLSIGRTYGELLKRFSDEKENLISSFCNLFRSNGWGEISLSKMDYEKGYGLLTVSSVPFKNNLSENLIRGIIAGFLEKVYDKKFNVRRSESLVKDYGKFIIEVGEK